MDTILHHSDGLATAGIALLYSLTVLAGVFLGARYGKAVLKPALIFVALTFAVRAFVSPVDIVGIVSMTVLHIAGGCLIGLLPIVRGGKTA